MPSASAGKWENDRVGGLVKLTDGEICPVVSHGPVTAFATAGEAGQFAVYTLPPSAGGYDLTNITVYGGWGDPNRAEQCFDVSCATAENPDEFVQIAAVRFKPPMEPGQASLSRSVLAGSPGKPLAKHVTKVRFDFKPGAFGYVGYSEITIGESRLGERFCSTGCSTGIGGKKT